MAKEKIITLWMAHGFLLSRGNLELEDVGNEVWNELYLRSFFQEIEVKSGNTYFKMHDLIHDLATSLFSASASSRNTREINFNHFGDTMMMSSDFIKVVHFYSPLHLKEFVSLRVLILSNSELEELPYSIGDLIHLRYLNLSCNKNIRSLPKQLCKLQNLQTLDLQYCFSLSCLPKQTSKLSSLRNLLLDYCPLTSMPPKIGSLTCLKTLDCFVVGERKGYQLGELRNLNLDGSISITQLERVKNDMDAKEANLSAKANLHSLSMSWDIDGPHRYESEETKVLEALKPHPNLKYFDLTGFRGFRLPDWMNHSVLKNVVSITINGCENCLCLPPFGELPCLESLALWKGSAEYVEEDDVHSGRFPSLRKLSIKYFRNLKRLLKKEGEEQFPMLEEMMIEACPMFVFPTLPSNLTSLCIDGNKEATSLSEEMFKSLTNLTYLAIRDYTKLRELPNSLTSLNALKHLDIIRCHALESLPEEGLKGLTSLTELSLQNCEMAKCLPKGLQHLTALATLRIIKCPELEKRCEKGTGEDWHKIAHIPNLKIYS